MSKSNSNPRGGIALPGVLGVAFIVLKLTDVIDWSWWWVLSPFWGGLALFIVLVILYALLSARKFFSK